MLSERIRVGAQFFMTLMVGNTASLANYSHRKETEQQIFDQTLIFRLVSSFRGNGIVGVVIT